MLSCYTFLFLHTLYQRRLSLFTTKELQSIDRSYFNVIQATCICVTLQSKNTKHFWHILHEEYPHFKTCQVSHKHNYSDAYHQHRNQPTLKKAIEEIKSHDEFQINARDKQKRTRHNMLAAGQKLA